MAKQITIFAGHYGSGKTNLAVNYAIALRKAGHEVVICDVDIVNPYFRTKDSEEVLRENGVRLIASPFANSNLDIPSVPPETSAAFDVSGVYSVFDVGGDDSGAVALGQFADRMNEREHEMILVINRHRLLTSRPEEVVTYMREIEAAARMRFTGIANNSNLGPQTTCEGFLQSLPYADAVSRLTGLPVLMHCVRADLAEQLAGKVPLLFPVHIYGKSEWKISEERKSFFHQLT